MDANSNYHEKLASNKTQALFLGLATIFTLLFTWRKATAGLGGWAVVFLIFAVFFIFYSLNYRTLVIRLTSEHLKLTFGVFSWMVPLDNIGDWEIDEIPAFLKYGGAGIHFMTAHGRYRASFNFLEYPRIVVRLNKKIGPVQDISFSTRRPDEILRFLDEAAAYRKAGLAVAA
jgi:hypothetical protein